MRKKSCARGSLWLNELGLGPDFLPLVDEHAEFFRAANRRKALKARLKAGDSPNGIRMKMLAVYPNGTTEPRLEAVPAALLDELAGEQDDRIRLIQRCNPDGFLWRGLGRSFGYRSPTPGTRDFAIELFKSSYALALGEEAALNPEALVFLNNWKDSRRFHQAFETLSDQCADILGIENDLQTAAWANWPASTCSAWLTRRSSASWSGR